MKDSVTYLQSHASYLVQFRSNLPLHQFNLNVQIVFLPLTFLIEILFYNFIKSYNFVSVHITQYILQNTALCINRPSLIDYIFRKDTEITTFF